MSLINKLTDKLKNVSKDTKKRILSLMLAGSIALTSGLGLTGCSLTNNPNTDDPNTNDPSSSITNPSGGKEDSKYSKYSSILQGVMTKKVYEKSLSWGTIEQNSGGVDSVMNNNRFLPIPYKYLEDLGYDSDRVRQGSYKASAEVFRIDNDLYVALGIQALSKKDYMEYHLLKYNITDQEIAEMNKLFNTKQSTYYNYTYFQAPFFVQELSYHRTPEVLNISYQSMDTQKTIIDGLNKNKFVAGGYNKNNAILLNFRENAEEEMYLYNCIIWPASEYAHYENAGVGLIELYSIYGKSWNPLQYIEDHEILNLTYKSDIYRNVGETIQSPYKTGESIVKADIYSSSDRLFEDVSAPYFWELTFE